MAIALWGGTRPVEGDVIVNTCALFQSVPISMGPYMVQTDYWNNGSCPGTQCMNIDTTTGAFSVTQGPTCGANTVGSYPDIMYGSAFGGSSPPPCALPAAISTLTCVTSDWNFSVSQTGVWDVAYDIWFCPDNTCGAAGFSGGAEMMIWLKYTSHGWEYDQGSATISGMPWEVWQWNQGSGSVTWNYIGYLSNAQTTSVTGLDIKAFIGDAISRGYIQPSWYLYAVEAGIEIQNGAVPFTSNSFSVSVNACSPTPSPTGTPTPTVTPTPVYTQVPCMDAMGNTCTPTPTPSNTSTPAMTPTINATSVLIGLPYPNPVKNTEGVNFDVQAPPGTALAWDVFTVSFRKIEGGSQTINENATVHWNLTGLTGNTLSNGLYYIRVKAVDGSNSTVKILKIIVLH